MTEAFDKIESWKSSGTVLKLLVSEKGNPPLAHIVNVASTEEASQIVTFADAETGLLTPLDFSDAVFVVGKSALEVVRPVGDVLITEKLLDPPAITTPNPSQAHFDLRFDQCGHAVTFPLVHSTGHLYCYVCQPHLQNIPIPGNCPDCA
jgi:hypothetical protein